ncbi:MAG: neutral zinc metallopeptidase [Muribaculaceae bacterium]|nr:neutral zinc metallopeptidase [Muribaculaceae bacterium]
MRLEGRRQSNNIVDKRRISGKSIGIGGGIIGVIVAAVITLMSGGGIGDVAQSALNQLSQQSGSAYVPDAEDERLATVASQILAGTEDVWTREFRQQGWGTYTPPKMVLYHGAIQTGCGQGSAQMGPFYCSADQTVYIDLDFFKNMEQTIGASGDFTYAYVIAHEVGHHVQYLLGTLDSAHNKMAELDETEANKISVRLELQADFYAGVWAHNDNDMFGSIEEGDIERAINAASRIGDDYLQRKATGREMPESFNHGRSQWRINWLSKGIETGDPRQGDTFSVPYGQF